MQQLAALKQADAQSLQAHAASVKAHADKMQALLGAACSSASEYCSGLGGQSDSNQGRGQEASCGAEDSQSSSSSYDRRAYIGGPSGVVSTGYG